MFECSYLEKYIEIQNAIVESNIGKGTILLSDNEELFDVRADLHPPAPSSVGNDEGQLARHSP